MASCPPNSNICDVIGGGIQARWALLSEQVAPCAPCDVNGRGKCLLVSNPDTYTNNTELARLFRNMQKMVPFPMPQIFPAVV